MKQIRMGPHNDIIHGDVDELFAPDDWEIEDRAGRRVFHGRLIGMGSSQRMDHNHGTTPIDGATGQALFDAYQNRGRCTACRWSEIYIFQASPGAKGVPPGAVYCVYTLGPSLIRGEFTRGNVRWATSGFEVVEMATIRRGDRGAPFLPAAHSRALGMAAHVDDDIAEAYVNRAVA